jgi:hypothetical protein
MGCSSGVGEHIVRYQADGDTTRPSGGPARGHHGTAACANLENRGSVDPVLVAFAQILLEFGADPRPKDRPGMTPINRGEVRAAVK